ncbi:fumarylacetoacetate hydrolase family protein [Antribacter sp. KLBMP9083]|uniref:Fumarylacetoacetate hydrolase family protein n=1 Tax=Antribacter soli TaxID=2910976 RepID=A0AA41U915_9MICO|nr:fumarylacetoacetate hydrolase family protein [Antribacter soli]MCF4121082.1 fumarylacetoacetate hydrolase family protein [Antribacter soli]
MRIATWEHRGSTGAGFVDGGRVFALPDGATTLDLVRDGLERTLDAGRRVVADGTGVPLSEVRLLPPIQPPAMRDFVAFEEHVEGVVKSVSGGAGVVPEWYQAPTFYFTNPHTLVATGDDVAVPSGSHALDFELEVAAVIGAVDGSDGRDLDPVAGREHIFGYTILNDWSARDLQRREMRVSLGPCKGKDFANTLGPWIVTADEVEDLHDDDGFLALELSVAINGVTFGRDLLSNMGWPFAELVAYASRSSRVAPGDVLGSGTSAGGCLAEAWGRAGSQTPPPLAPGDTVRMEVERIGVIENTVVAGRDLPAPAPARVRPRTRTRTV